MKKALLLIGFCIIQMTAFAQVSAREILKQKTENDLKEIIGSSPSLTGLMAIDLTSGEIIGINSDIVFTQASAIKIPILMEVYKQAHEKKFALSDIKPLVASNIVAGSGILNAMTDPVNLSIRNYCMLMIGLSDNSATNTLIELVGMKNINSTMQSLGFPNTKVQRKMIDQPASLRNEENLSTPAEAARIMKLLHEGKFIDKTSSEEILSILKKNPIENSKLAGGLPSNVKLAFKPGGMGGVSTEWGIVYLSNSPYAIAVMENYKTSATPSDIIAAISKRVFDYFSMLKATKYGVLLGN
ncbi:beta-lactamase class A [Daejeonella rubra]|uniref:beta-lactamase n=1 Tax=Daejeonella rubra TaxID=990371 RepID=A0A1G9XZ66_9SPHI|nr:serine hydrolase [Daejeonella rubra]SDN02109.1 beta-lactamase class A [Daejeonella rubra]